MNIKVYDQSFTASGKLSDTTPTGCSGCNVFVLEKLSELEQGGVYKRLNCQHGFDPLSLKIDTEAGMCNYLAGIINWNMDAQNSTAAPGRGVSTCVVGHCPPRTFIEERNSDLVFGAVFAVITVLCWVMYRLSKEDNGPIST